MFINNVCNLCNNQYFTDDQILNNEENKCISCQLNGTINLDELGISRYYDTREFNNLTKRKHYNHILSMAHFNCRSLKKNFDHFTSYLNCIDIQFSVIGLTETWLRNNECSLLSIPHYTFLSHNRAEKRGGGVGFYIKENVTFKRRFDLDIFTDDVESIFIEVFCKLTKIIIAVVYRPPNQSIVNFMNALAIPMETIVNEKKECILLGDFNIDLLNKISSDTANFVDTLSTYSLSPLIFKATRVTQQSSTLLDNIFTNNLEQIIQSGIFICDISDHFPVFAFINLDLCNTHINELYYSKRTFEEDAVLKFCVSLQEVEWCYLESIVNTNDRFIAFMDMFTSIFAKCFPLQKIKSKKKTKKYKPWFNFSLKKMCKKKYILLRKFLKNSTPVRETNYKRYRNITNEEIRKRKREYYHAKFNNAHGKVKYTWNVINEVLNKPKSKVQCEHIEVDGKMVENKQSIAEHFNEYFSSVGLNVINNSPTSMKSFSDFLPPGNAQSTSMFFKPITGKEILDIVNNLQDNKSPGEDEIDAKVFKRSIYFILKPLCNIFNQSLQEGVFPERLKVAKVIPIHKKGDIISP